MKRIGGRPVLVWYGLQFGHGKVLRQAVKTYIHGSAIEKIFAAEFVLLVFPEGAVFLKQHKNVTIRSWG